MGVLPPAQIPLRFDAYTVFNLYKDKNAYYAEGPFRRTPRPGQRNYLGQVKVTLEETNHRELALGTHIRVRVISSISGRPFIRP